jgi:RNA polymerase sigma-70 factor (ECF subfamily)
VTEQEQKLIFENWLGQHKGLIFKIIRAYAFTAMDRDDLFQDVALQVWRSIPSFRHESAVTTWIYRVALNTAIQWIRKEQKQPRTNALDDVQYLLRETETTIDERIAWLYEEIHKLNEIDRSITLLMLDNLSYKEMAEILGITESNVGVRINRIKKQLITKSKKYDYGI